MDFGEQTTGTRDEQYNLISVLYHALQSADACDTYALDAEAARRPELAGFFREAQIAYAGIAELAKELLGIPEVPPRVGVPPGAAPEELAPPEEEVVVEEDIVVEEVIVEGDVVEGDIVEDAVMEEVVVEEAVVEDEALADTMPEAPEAGTVRVAPEDLEATIDALRGGVANLEIERALAEIDDWQLRLGESGDPELRPVAENLRRLSALLTADETDARAVGEVLKDLGGQAQHLADSGVVTGAISERLKTLGGLLASEGGELSG